MLKVTQSDEHNWISRPQKVIKLKSFFGVGGHKGIFQSVWWLSSVALIAAVPSGRVQLSFLTVMFHHRTKRLKKEYDPDFSGKKENEEGKCFFS